MTEDWYELCELNFGLGLERCLKYGQAEGGGEDITNKMNHINKNLEEEKVWQVCR